MTDNKSEDCWDSYLDHFEYFSSDLIRTGNHPRSLVHAHPVENSIVLVHGLSDSPFYMKAIGEFFHTELGYNIYMPLLHCHGLKDPQGMESVALEEWKRNVIFAIDEAAATQSRVSIGGFSTGGALSYLMAMKNAKVTGALYLFSAALDLSDKNRLITGNVKELALKSKRFINLTERAKSLMTRASGIFGKADNDAPDLIGLNPYKYKFVDLDGAHQLVRLIEETDAITASFNSSRRIAKPVFISHSEVDETVDVKAVKELEKLCTQVDSHYLPAKLNVGHAEVVLRDDITPTDPGKEQNRNPQFDDMTNRIATFARRQITFA